MGYRFHISCLQDDCTILLGGPLTYTLKRKKIQRERDKISKTVTSDNVGNECILQLNGRSIDLHIEELETLREPFGIKKPSLVCCSETWMVESQAEDLCDLNKYAPMKFQPEKN